MTASSRGGQDETSAVSSRSKEPRDVVTLTVLDVGHGSCAFLTSDGENCIIDGGQNSNLLALLRAEHVTYIDYVVISHADVDHVRGLRLAMRALPHVKIGRVLVNPCQSRKTRDWKLLVDHLETRRERDGTVLGPLTVDHSSSFSLGKRCKVEVLSPRYTDIMGPHNVNSTSGVLKLVVDDVPQALLPGDMDANTFARLHTRNAPMHASILIFPHHGGGAATTRLAEFGHDVIRAVEPNLTLVSLGRNMFGNPHPEIVNGIHAAQVETHIACTQLSKNCSATAISGSNDRTGLLTRDREQCIGTVHIDFAPDGSYTTEPTILAHRQFLTSQVPDRLCRAVL